MEGGFDGGRRRRPWGSTARRSRLGLIAAAALLLAVAQLPRLDGAPPTRRALERQSAQAKQGAKSAAQAFLEHSGQSLMVPVDVEVFLIGLDGRGGYAAEQDAAALSGLLSAALPHHCPHSLESGEELGVCFQITFSVMGADQLGDEAAALLTKIESHLKANMKESPVHWAQRNDPNRTLEYTVDAAPMEPLFDQFLRYVYGVDQSEGENGHNWHQHNAIFVINPSKVRINPKGSPEDAQHQVPHFLEKWKSHTYDPADLAREEAGLLYRYTYGGAGEAATWLSSRNYAVIDVAAGPSAYGPAVGREGAVTPGALPLLKDVYASIMGDLRDVGPTLTAQEHAQVVAQHAQRSLFEGALAAAISSAAAGLFVPDMASENIEYAKNILVPVVLLTDYELTQEDYDARTSQENFMHVNLTHVEAALARLIDEQQEAVVVSAHHPLSRHRALAGALWRARVTKSEQALDSQAGQAARMGMHTVYHTSIDPDCLMEELALAADALTHSLVSAAHVSTKEGAHPLEQLRHEGTRVVPVFVFSLMNAPDDIMFSNRDMVAANHDAVMVLQLRKSAQWGGTRDEYFTGHMANGRRVSGDARDVTRHIIAGLAQALSGVVPPYVRPREKGAPPDAPQQHDWRWAVGATPFGPHSSFAGVSEITQNAARRNLLLAHATAALRAAQARLDEVDEFVAKHFEGPWAAAGVPGAPAAGGVGGGGDGRRHFLDTVVGTRHGFKTGLTPEAVSVLEGQMAILGQQLEELAMDLFAHDFAAADRVIREGMLPAAANLCNGLDATLEEANAIMACCATRHTNAFARTLWLLGAAAAAFAAVFAVGVGFAVASGRRRRLARGFQLPTYGLSPYPSSRPTSRQHSWQL